MNTPAGHAENPYAGQGSVLLDIGDDVGAVVVTMPDGMDGVEVEIRPDKGRHHHGRDHLDHGHHPHVAVVARPVQGGRLPSLVFPEVEQGRYGLYLKDSCDKVVQVTVSGGEVTTVTWPR
ncbi:MAG: hypothetical protein QOK15_756 [Nocardioidaceae bacterium]|nr:hypothetical protein [Nocardioidaceae bacterium]